MRHIADAIARLEVMIQQFNQTQGSKQSDPKPIPSPEEAVALIDRAWELVFGAHPQLVAWVLPCTSCGKDINLSRSTDYSNAERKFIVGQHVLCTPCRKIGVMRV